MTTELIISSVLITLALVFYTLGVWAERVSRFLKPWHVSAFWMGLAFDATGTFGMSLLTERTDWTDIHTITGQVAIWLMLGHAVWATWVVRRGSEQARTGFHRYSLAVWLVWLVPYLGGMFVGMGNLS